MGKVTSFLTGLFLTLLIIQIIPSVVKNFKDKYEDIFELKTKVGLLTINGSIQEIGTYLKNLKKFFEKDDIKAILLHIESPGGAAGASQALFNEILFLKKEHPKPVVILVNDICASGGYYIACAGDYIVSSPCAIIGSIGSYLGSFKIKELIESWKAQYNIKYSGKYKTALNPFTENTPEMNDLMQEVSDDTYKQFANDVATHRKLSMAQSDKWANGKFFTGRQAYELKLVDELGSQSNSEKKIRELAMIEKEKKIEWVKPSKFSKYEQFFGMDEENIDSLMDKILKKICLKLGISDDNAIMFK